MKQSQSKVAFFPCGHNQHLLAMLHYQGVQNTFLFIYKEHASTHFLVSTLEVSWNIF